MDSATSAPLGGDAPGSAPDDGPVAGQRSSLGPRGLLLAVSAFVTILLTAFAGLLPVPFVALSPGPVTDVIAGSGEGEDPATGLIRIEGAPTYPTQGRLDLTTVSLRGGPGRDMTLVELLLDWRDGDVAVLPRGLYFRADTTQQQADAESAAEMTGSQESAKVAALTELGIDVPATTTRRVASVYADVPAADVLRVGDEITAVDGVDVPDFAALQTAIRALPEDAPVTLGVLRGGKPVTVTTRTVSSGGTTAIGIVPVVEYDLPFSIDIDLDDVGGPSAGTMFALGIVDELTPGAMTGDEHVAGTGSITADGTVGPIGGLRQKVVGSQEAGARWFLAPREECGQVAGATPDGITVVPITTLHDAVQAVTAIGEGTGDALTTCDEVAAAD